MTTRFSRLRVGPLLLYFVETVGERGQKNDPPKQKTNKEKEEIAARKLGARCTQDSRIFFPRHMSVTIHCALSFFGVEYLNHIQQSPVRSSTRCSALTNVIITDFLEV